MGLLASRTRHQVALLVLSVLIAGGCAGGGCSCMQPSPNGFPSTERTPNAIQVRLSESGVSFLEANATTVIESLVPGGLTFPVETCGGNPEVCCMAAPGTCGPIAVDLAPQPGDAPRLEINPQQGMDLAKLVLRARVKTVQGLKVKYDTGIGTANCTIHIDTTAAGNASVTVRADLRFSQDPEAQTTRVDAQNVTLEDFDNGDLDIDGNFLCDLADLFKGFFTGMIRDQFASQIQDTINEQLCKSCEAGPGTCGEFATCNADKVCMKPDGRCLQELGVAGRLRAAALFASLSPGQSGGMDLYDVAGGYATTDANGLSLGILGGALPPDGATDTCVPPAPKPAPPAGGIPRVAAFQGNTIPGTPQTFHVGVGVSDHFLNLNAWAAHQGGMLCLNVGTRSVELLTSDTLSLLAGSMSDLLHLESGQLILALRPQKPPVVTLDEGTFLPSGEIDKPLLRIAMNELEIDVYLMVDQRFIRIMTVKTDFLLPLGLEVTDTGQLLPVLGDLADAFTNVTVKNSELLKETPEEIAATFPILLSVALPLLTDALGAVDLPTFGGLAIRPVRITSIENNTFLAIFADLAAAPSTKPSRVDTHAAVLDVRVPPTEAFRAVRLDDARRPTVRLAFGGVNGSGTDRDLEWQFRLDGAGWSPFLRTRTYELSRKALWLQGRHRIEVRAREIGRPETLDPTPAVVEAIVDTVPPRVTLTHLGDAVHVEAKDAVSPGGAMVVSYRFGPETEWRAAGTVPARVPLGRFDPGTLEVRVTDEAGNVGFAGGADLILGFHGRAPAGDGGCACQVGGGGRANDARASGLAALLLAALGVALGRTRRAGRARALVARGRRSSPVGGAPRAKRALRRRMCGPPTLIALVLSAPLVPGCTCGSASGPPADGNNEVIPATIGRYSDLAAADGRVLISAYEEGFGDLVVSDLHDGSWLAFQPIDGVPEAPAALDPDGYRKGILEPGPNVGAWTSVALHQKLGRVAYQDLDAGALKFAIESEGGVWTNHVVDPGGGGAAGRAGLYTSLTLDGNGVPGIAYLAYAVENADGTLKAQLRWAQARSTAPSGPGDWTIETIAEAVTPCAGLCGAGRFCVAASNSCKPKDTGCNPACDEDNAQGCVAGACVQVMPDPKAVDLPEGTGLFASAGRLPDGRPVVAFYDRNQGDLLLAVRGSDGAWTVAPLDASPDTDRGQWASLAVTSDGVVHVAYQDALADDLLYLSWTEGGGATAPVVIDNGERPGDRPHPVGAGVALGESASGRLIVAYQDSATSDLLYSVRDAAWSEPATLQAGPPGYGFYTAIGHDGRDTWVSNYVYDRTERSFGIVRVHKVP